MDSLISSIGNIAPPVASLLIMAIVGWRILEFLFKTNKETLDMFNRHGDALKSIENNMNAHTLVIKELGSNIAVNTRATEQMSRLLEKKIK